MKPLRLAWLRLTGCSGCQLSLLNAEPQLAAAASCIEVIRFPMLSSHHGRLEQLDAALVEGALTTPEELSELMMLRRCTPFLIAVGACALSGGVPALAGERRGERFAEVYEPEKPCHNFPPQPVRSFVRVDLEIPGCPPEPEELLVALGSLAHGGPPELDSYPVCFECRLRENRCLLFETSPRHPCLGALTRAGCQARCPSLGIPCEGCRGRLPEARLEALKELLVEAGFTRDFLDARLNRFGEAP